MRLELDPHLFGKGQPCFGCSPDHPTGFRLRFAREEDVVVTRFTPGAAHQGPPGLMHGGLVMTLEEKFGFTAHCAAKLRKPVRIESEVLGRGRITKATSRVVKVHVDLEQAEARVFEADLDFVLVDEAGAERLLGAPLPPEWKRFCR